MRVTAIAAALVLSASTVLAQELPKAEILTKQMQEAAQKRQNIQYVREITGEVTLNGQPVTEVRVGNQRLAVPSSTIGKQTVAISNPGKARVEMELGPATIMVSDGETTWTYRPTAKLYSKVAAAQGPDGVAASLAVLDVLGFFQDSKSGKTVRDETIEVDGKTFDRWVVTSNVKIPPQAALPGTQITDGIMTSWIDKKLLFAVREDLSYSYKVAATVSGPQVEYQAKLRQFVRSLKVDEPIVGTLFAFLPPADAHEDTTPAGARPRNDLTGKEALAFDAMSIDGKSSFSLASLKGKPVLLDFWATWCGPCLKSQPALEKIYQDFKDKGFIVLGVDVGEKRDVVETFLKTHEMGYPVIVGSETSIPATYQATAFPTFVVIDANGTVAAHQIGFNNEATLRNLVARVGLTASASGNALTPTPGK